MTNNASPNFNLFFAILQTLEAIQAPYMIIGAFAAILYGSSRTTYDIDIIVDLNEEHIDALAAAYPPPRYYADPEQMRSSIHWGIMFNIIDTSRGEKADLVPLTMEQRYRFAFANRIRQTIKTAGIPPFEAWCARPEDIIVGKLMAWAEGRSRKHETDIYEMLVMNALRDENELGMDTPYIDTQAQSLSEDVVQLWQAIKAAVQQQSA